jgi:hypothetical protein
MPMLLPSLGRASSADLSLSEEQVARVDGGSVEADVRTQQVIEAFGQERSPIRILIASDMASDVSHFFREIPKVGQWRLLSH